MSLVADKSQNEQFDVVRCTRRTRGHPRSRVQPHGGTRAIVWKATYSCLRAVSLPSYLQLGVEGEGGVLLDSIFKRVVAVLVHLLIIRRRNKEEE